MPGEEVTVSGWVRSVRYQKDVAFMELNDGSCLKSLQVVMDSNLAKSAELATGASAVVEGSLVQSPAAAQRVELSAKSVTLVGSCDQKAYALQKKVCAARQLPLLTI